MKEWFGDFMLQIRETPLLEWLGVGFGVVQVLLAKANHVWLYPFGIASVLITIYVLFGAGLYAEVLLNVYYFVMSVYGWWYWTSKGGEEPLPITYSSKQDWVISSGIVLLGTPLLYGALVAFTDSTVPFWDSVVTATAWAGMWLLARRKIENWILLNISNAVAIPLLAYKGIPMYALLTLFLFVVAIFGFLDWKRKITHAYVGDR